MKLSGEELERLAAQLGERAKRTAPGESGTRAQPLSYAKLLAERRRLLGRLS